MKNLKDGIKILYDNSIKAFNTLYWLSYQLLYRNFKSYNKLNENYNSKKLIILANGPSLKHILDDLPIEPNDTEYSVVNFFAMDSHFTLLKPSHYVLADPEFFLNSGKLSIAQKELLGIINNNVNWKMNLYIPIYASKIMKKRITNPQIKIKPFHSNSYEGWISIRHYLYRKGLSMPKSQNVLIPSIYIGINEGYRLIELFGVDHSWTTELIVNKINQVCSYDSHFYDDQKLHLKPFYRGFGQPNYTMHELLRDLARVFEGYHKLRRYADSLECKIINKTPNSFIDAFERENKKAYDN